MIRMYEGPKIYFRKLVNYLDTMRIPYRSIEEHPDNYRLITIEFDTPQEADEAHSAIIENFEVSADVNDVWVRVVF